MEQEGDGTCVADASDTKANRATHPVNDIDKDRDRPFRDPQSQSNNGHVVSEIYNETNINESRYESNQNGYNQTTTQIQTTSIGPSGPSGDAPDAEAADETSGSTDLSEQAPSDASSVISLTARDASKTCGERNADEIYNQFFTKYEYKGKIYRVPPLFIGKAPSKAQDLQSQSNEQFLVFETTRSDVRGDIAEKIVADCIENMLTHWVPNKYPAFVITSFRFENFCNKTDKEPKTDRNRYTRRSSGDQNSNDGEHDILIVHYKFGVFCVQVKSCEQTTDPNNTVKKAIEQTKEDETFFSDNFSDLKTGVTIRTALALPDVGKIDMKNLHTHSNCCKRIKQHYVDGLDRCLFKNDLPSKQDSNEILAERKCNLLSWWEKITRNSKGFNSFEDYKRIVARYIGFKSTVKIPDIHQLSPNTEEQEARTLERCISHIGSRYMNIVLTPQQVCVLNTDLHRLVIRGQYGAGKTVLLVLKVRQLLKEKTKVPVCVITMSKSPLIHVLEASVKYDLEPLPYNILFKTAHTQSQLSSILEDCSREERHIFIDEFPSFMYADKGLQTMIKDYPQDLHFWCIMGRERNDEMSRGPNQIFSIANDSVPKFQDILMEKNLRCPPSIQEVVPHVSKPIERYLFGYLEGNLDTEQTRKNMTSHFHSLGLSTSQTQQLKWSDVVVLAHPASRQFCSMLKKLKVPLLRVSDVVQYTKDDVKHIKFRVASSLDMSAYTHSEEGFLDAVRVAELAGTEYAIYIRGAKMVSPVEQLDNSKVSVARFLFENGFINDEIIKESKKLHVDQNVSSRKWCDIIFVDRKELERPAEYSFLEQLGIPLVTPSRGAFSENAVLFTNNSNYEGFYRKESITFDKGQVIANVKEFTCLEGPEPIHIRHTNHNGQLDTCDACKNTLKEELLKLGMITSNRVTRPAGLKSISQEHKEEQDSVQPSDSRAMFQNMLAVARQARHDLTFADLVILDDRTNPQSAVKLFEGYDVPVVDKLASNSLDADDAFGSETKVIYTKPHLFKGLERKVVVVLKNKHPPVASLMKGGVIEDDVEVPITRCASQLIIIWN